MNSLWVKCEEAARWIRQCRTACAGRALRFLEAWWQSLRKPAFTERHSGSGGAISGIIAAEDTAETMI